MGSTDVFLRGYEEIFKECLFGGAFHSHELEITDAKGDMAGLRHPDPQ